MKPNHYLIPYANLKIHVYMFKKSFSNQLRDIKQEMSQLRDKSCNFTSRA